MGEFEGDDARPCRCTTTAWARLAIMSGWFFLLPAAASDLSWTPCHRLEMGGRLQATCQECAAKGQGWRFYVSRSGSVSQCRRDQQSPGIYRQSWAEEDVPERREGQPSPAVTRRESRHRDEPRAYQRSYAPPARTTTSSGSQSSSSASSSSKRTVVSHEPPRTTRPPPSHASPQPARPVQQKTQTSSSTQPAHHRPERKHERKKAVP